jgi:TPR repeat protein
MIETSVEFIKNAFAATSGSVIGMYNLACLFESVQKYKQSMQWLEKAAARGFVPAIYNLGVYYEHGLGVDQSYSKAQRYYETAAAEGDLDATYNLGGLYFRAQNYTDARIWFEKAANQSYIPAMHNLGVLYDQGLGVPQDYDRARFWYGKAAAGGDVESRKALQRLM